MGGAVEVGDEVTAAGFGLQTTVTGAWSLKPAVWTPQPIVPRSP
jgi:hypothetical protein